MSKALLRSTGVVGSMTLVSRILGFVRDLVIARIFGVGADTDAFFAALRIPNTFRRFFAEGAFSLAFVPVFSQYRAQKTPDELKRLLEQVTGTLGLLLFLVTVVGVLAAPLLIWIVAPGFTNNTEQYELAVTMLRITFPYLLFISLTALAGGVLNSFGQFAVPALTPALLNIVLIMAAVIAAPWFEESVMALSWGVFFAGIAQLLVQIPSLYRLKLLPRPRWAWASAGVVQIRRLMIPALFGSSVGQINILFGTLLASLLTTGSVTWLYYSDRLMEFPLGLIGVALGTVILPSLSRKHAADSTKAFSQTLDWALRWVLLIGVPATVALVILAGPLLSTLFQYGEFGTHDVIMSSHSLMAYALGLQAWMLVKVLAPGFYARQNTRTPVRIGIIAMVANMLMSLVLFWPLAHVGLALATSGSAFINAGLLYQCLRRDQIYQPSPGWLRFLVRIILANAVMGALLWTGAGELSSWLQADGGERVAHLTWLVVLGILAYAVALLAAGMRPRHLKAQH